MGKKNDNTLVKNASFLMVAALISKIIGMLYKSPLSTTLGSQSFALFQFAQNVYFILLMIASFSIPQAVSKIMAEKIAFHRYKDAQKVFYGALIYAAVAGGIVALICVFGAGILVPDSMANARLALQMLAPTIFMSGLCGVFRGYFQDVTCIYPAFFRNRRYGSGPSLGCGRCYHGYRSRCGFCADLYADRLWGKP